MRISALVIIAITACVAMAQNKKGFDILEQFDRRFVLLDSLIFKNADESRSAALTVSDASQYATGSNREALNRAIDRRVDAEIGEIKSQTGLRLTGQTYYRLDGDLGIDPEEDAVSRYNAKIQAEVRWYPFQSAIFKRKGRIEERRLQGRIDRMAYDKEDLGMLVERQKEAFRQYSDSLLGGVLLHRIKNLNMLSGAYTYLLENGNISSDDLLNILNEKAEAERRLASIPGMQLPALDLSRPLGYIVEVDTAEFLKYVRQTQADLSTLQLRMQLLRQREKNTSYWTEFNAAPFVRYSYYTRPELANSSNVDAGVVFTIPLSFEFWKKKQALKAQQEVLATEESHIAERILEAANAILLDIERYNRASIGEYRRMAELKKYLSMRGEAYSNRVGEYNRLARMKEYNSYLMCCEKFIEFQYSKDCCIADLQKFLTDVSVLRFCREVPIDSTLIDNTPQPL